MISPMHQLDSLSNRKIY
ncbi:hypothetical protein FWK35_00031422 [Aphis craccivora]|uniref:Uncharacterized protein n=1 Tax=Aphis craccivora TaxID=307492 RepID=A0A6G0X4Y3_APHCR|nr:hypothetical protein FWK35_00031422 [Aphis craccivora]